MPSKSCLTRSCSNFTRRGCVKSLCMTYRGWVNEVFSNKFFLFYLLSWRSVFQNQKTTDPHVLYIFYEILFYHGLRRADAFRSHKRWQPLLPLLMDHVLVEMDPDVEDTYTGSTHVGRSASSSSVPIPIEAKLRSLCVKILYEVCKVQTLSVQDLSKEPCKNVHVFIVCAVNTLSFLFYSIQKYLKMILLIIFMIWSNRQSICRTKLSIIPSSNLLYVFHLVFFFFRFIYLTFSL